MGLRYRFPIWYPILRRKMDIKDPLHCPVSTDFTGRITVAVFFPKKKDLILKYWNKWKNGKIYLVLQGKVLRVDSYCGKIWKGTIRVQGVLTFHLT